MKLLISVLAVCAAAMVGCAQKRSEPSGPTLASCSFTPGDSALTAQGMTEVPNFSQIRAGTIKMVGADYYVNISGDKTKQAHFSLDASANPTNACASNVDKDNQLPSLSAQGISLYSLDENYFAVQAFEMDITQNNDQLVFARKPIDVKNAAAGDFLASEGWQTKIYLTVDGYQVRLYRKTNNVEETLVTKYTHSEQVLTAYAECNYSVSPVSMESKGMLTNYKSLPPGQLNFAGAEMYVARGVAGKVQSAHVRYGVNEQPNVVCVSGLSSSVSYEADTSTVSKLVIDKTGPTDVEVGSFGVNPVSYKVTPSFGSVQLVPLKLPDEVMNTLWALGSYHFFQISPTEYEVRATVMVSGQERDLLVRYNFVPAN